jgi:hypothetical protein
MKQTNHSNFMNTSRPISFPLDLTIGADPEISIQDKLNKQISAYTFFGTSRSPIAGEFGTDGNPDTLEIRPQYAHDPITLTKNIKSIFLANIAKYPKLFSNSLYCGSDEFSIGGHIQFGHKKILQSFATSDQKLVKTLAINLDLLLALPLAYIETPESRNKRVIRTGYGKFSDFRPQSWGVEYRTLPSWLASERVTRATLCLAYAVAVDTIYNKLELFPSYPYLMVKDAFNQDKLDVLEFFIPQTMKHVRHLTYYSYYRKSIGYLLDACIKKHPLLTTEIKNGWHIKSKLPHIADTRPTFKAFCKNMFEVFTTDAERSSPSVFIFERLQLSVYINKITGRLNLQPSKTTFVNYSPHPTENTIFSPQVPLIDMDGLFKSQTFVFRNGTPEIVLSRHFVNKKRLTAYFIVWYMVNVLNICKTPPDKELFKTTVLKINKALKGKKEVDTTTNVSFPNPFIGFSDAIGRPIILDEFESQTS